MIKFILTNNNQTYYIKRAKLALPLIPKEKQAAYKRWAADNKNFYPFYYQYHKYYNHYVAKINAK
jgi:hypothetical protein